MCGVWEETKKKWRNSLQPQLSEPSSRQSPFLKISGPHPSSWFLESLHEVSALLHICCATAAAPQSPGLNANKRLTRWQQQWWLNSLGKCLPLMHGNLGWRSTWRCPAAVHSPRSALMHYLTTDQTHVTACMRAPPSLSFWLYLFIFLLCFLCTRLPCYAGEGEWMKP